MITINENHLQATNGNAYPQRSFGWSGLPILDACTVHADYGQLLLLTTNGVLYGINLDTGVSVQLCMVDLPDTTETVDQRRRPSMATYRLHATLDGGYAAIVVDKRRSGIVVEILTGAITMHLDGGDYYENLVPFSACFLCFEGRNVLIHRTAWNRLDAADPATGKSLTDRYIAPYESGREMPAHYLNYFHGQLRPSPDGSRIFDDGWVWHPVAIPRTWSVADWLHSNPWESEDGDSIVDLGMFDGWTIPACWISDRHVAIWGLGVWDEDEGEETGHGTGVRIFDVTESKQLSDGRWPMETDAKFARDLFSDGKRLYIATDTGTTVWEIVSREQITSLPNFTARLHDLGRSTLLAIGPATITEFSLSSLTAK